MYDMTPEEIINIIRKNNGNGIIYIEYQYYQIGLDKEWLRNISAKIADPLTVRREILLQRINGSSLSPFPREDVEYIASTMNEPIDQYFVSGFYQFDVYEKLNPSVPYIVGVDCSTGTASDNRLLYPRDHWGYHSIYSCFPYIHWHLRLPQLPEDSFRGHRC